MRFPCATRHVLVDTLGLVLHALVTAADVQDRDGGAWLMSTLFGRYPFLLNALPGGRGQARRHPGRGRRRRQALLAALVVVPAGGHPQPAPGRAAADGRRATAGRSPHRRARRGEDGRRPHGRPAPGGRALRLLRRGVDRLPGPPRRRLPRLRGRRAAPGGPARRRPCARSTSS